MNTMTSSQVTQISLEALLLRATNPNNTVIDSAAVDAFCALVNKEKDGTQIGVKVFASRLPIGNEAEVLFTLNVLDLCMSKCGTPFQNEVGKFRFLNEMIKLVSPKYLGSKTPLSVKVRILELLYIWTLDYPKEVKIKEAFDMLKKQGVVKDIPNPNIPQEALLYEKKKVSGSVFHDEEKSNILRKLLQSKDPEDIQAANWLIKSMVKEEEKLSDLKSRAISELESVQNNLKLLNEMLGSYKKGITTTSELDLMKELYDNLVRLRPNLTAIACHNNQCPSDLFDSISKTSDEVTDTLSKYHRIILLNEPASFSQSNVATPFSESDPSSSDISLIKMDNSEPQKHCSPNISVCDQIYVKSIDVLCDLFEGQDKVNSRDILKPISVSVSDKSFPMEQNGNRNNKFKALEELDVLSEHLSKENLQSSSFRHQGKIPMNLYKTNDHSRSQTDESFQLDLNYLLEKCQNESNTKLLTEAPNSTESNADVTDDCLVDISEDISKCTSGIGNDLKQGISAEKNDKTDLKIDSLKLNDVSIRLEEIKPSSKKSITAMEEKNGVTILIHLAKDRPRSGVSVYVLSTISKKDVPLSGYIFQAVVPKGCKLKLQQPSSRELPAFNPFLPPAAITQIMLVANPENIPVNLKFVLTYVADDDSITEMGEVDLPTDESD
ncbi:ADP-ribosylation factor-binding protein GGA1 isoform X1 [Cylas formicarius]|uniref:ADP-ribosylation factor-binding protein GGA1 isoform X1 n=1 Tax=Cylas formicarius TaxID=197179 RepID=UPI0029585439|nr:ADP-ribosylation factor-binding protein GGA1 isoform X1 [Cylas formicarius]